MTRCELQYSDRIIFNVVSSMCSYYYLRLFKCGLLNERIVLPRVPAFSFEDTVVLE